MDTQRALIAAPFDDLGGQIAGYRQLLQGVVSTLYCDCSDANPWAHKRGERSIVEVNEDWPFAAGAFPEGFGALQRPIMLDFIHMIDRAQPQSTARILSTLDYLATQAIALWYHLPEEHPWREFIMTAAPQNYSYPALAKWMWCLYRIAWLNLPWTRLRARFILDEFVDIDPANGTEFKDGECSCGVTTIVSAEPPPEPFWSILEIDVVDASAEAIRLLVSGIAGEQPAGLIDPDNQNFHPNKSRKKPGRKPKYTVDDWKAIRRMSIDEIVSTYHVKAENARRLRSDAPRKLRNVCDS